jgi:hypothetical protein
LREDWDTVRRGVETGERDFWRGVEDVKRGLQRLFD